MKKYVKFGVVFIILLALFITYCSKVDREKAKNERREKAKNERVSKAERTQAMNSNRQAVESELMTFGSMIVQYHRKPASQAGGGNNVATAYDKADLGAVLGWSRAEITAGSKTTDTGTFTFVPVPAPGIVTIVGVGTEKGRDGATGVKATNTITLADRKPFGIISNN